MRGTRVPASLIVGQIAHGATPDEIPADYPDHVSRRRGSTRFG